MTSPLRFLRDRSAEGLRNHYGPRRIEDLAYPGRSGVRRVSFENFTLDELIRHLERAKLNGAMRELLNRYRIRRNFPDMGNFRMGPNMFDQTALDWIALYSTGSNASQTELIAHGITTRLNWDGESSKLPRGWMGAVRQSYVESMLDETRPTTLVGLFIYAEKAFREDGWAAEVAEEMKRIARRADLRELIIPLRLPTRYEAENAAMPFETFALRKRDDGQYRDHWLRMHVRLGAAVIGVSSVSHQHAMHPEDLRNLTGCERFVQSGEHLVKWNDEHYSVIVDLEGEYAVINEGCVWVRHPLASGVTA